MQRACLSLVVLFVGALSGCATIGSIGGGDHGKRSTPAPVTHHGGTKAQPASPHRAEPIPTPAAVPEDEEREQVAPAAASPPPEKAEPGLYDPF